MKAYLTSININRTSDLWGGQYDIEFVASVFEGAVSQHNLFSFISDNNRDMFKMVYKSLFDSAPDDFIQEVIQEWLTESEESSA